MSYYNKGKSKRARGDDDEEGGVAGDPDAGAIVKFELSSKRRVKVYTFSNMKLCDIREMYSNAAGMMMPTKKGISLTADQLKALLEHGPELLAAMGEGAPSSASGASPARGSSASAAGAAGSSSAGADASAAGEGANPEDD